MPIAVNLDISESEVVSLNSSELTANLMGTGVTIVNPGVELADVIESNRNQRSFWRYFMILGFAFLIMESFLLDYAKESESKTGSPQVFNQSLGENRMPEAIPFIGPIEEVFGPPIVQRCYDRSFCSDHIILNLSVSPIRRHTTDGKNKSRNRTDRCPDPGNDLSARTNGSGYGITCAGQKIARAHRYIRKYVHQRPAKKFGRYYFRGYRTWHGFARE